MRWIEKCKEKARRAINKPPVYGHDIDIGLYDISLELEEEKKELFPGAEKRFAGSYVQIDHSVIVEEVGKQYKGEIEIMRIEDALEAYDWLEDYWWKAVKVDTDKFTALAELKLHGGYFIRILPGKKVELPIHACMLIYHDRTLQNVHNIVIAEPNSEAHIISGCAIRPISRGLHVGITEFYIKKGAKLVYTMIHNWSEDTHVRPRSAAILEENSTFINNYINLRSVGSIQAYPSFVCQEDNSRVSVNSIVFGDKDSIIDLGAEIVLKGLKSRGEIISRAVARDNAQIVMRGRIVGESNESKGHYECRGLLLSDTAMIHSIPELIGRRQGSELSHEAAIGKISRDEIEYLMSRGLEERDAVSLIIKGFLDIELMNLPEQLANRIKVLVDMTTEKAI